MLIDFTDNVIWTTKAFETIMMHHLRSLILEYTNQLQRKFIIIKGLEFSDLLVQSKKYNQARARYTATM